LRIALIQRFLPSRSRGGVGHFTHGLADALARRGHEVTVISQDPAPEGANYQVLQAGKNISRWSPLLFPFQAARCDFSAFDVIHAQGDDQWLTGHRPPLVRTLHGSSLAEAAANGLKELSPKHFCLHLYFYFWELISVLRADYVTAVSQDTRRHYPRLHRVIGNGIDSKAFAPEGVAKSRRPSILFVGEMQSRKRGHLLAQLFREKIRPAVPEAELWLVSPKMHEEEGVRWFSQPSFTELVRLYQEAWVFCLPSSYEGFGRPYIEAMAAGTAVVASPNPGAREVLDNGRFGIVAKDQELAPELIGLLGNEEKRGRMAKLGLERAREYDWDFIAGEYVKIYSDLIQKKKRNA